MNNIKSNDSFLVTIITEGSTMEPSYLEMLENEFNIKINIKSPMKNPTKSDTDYNWSQWDSFFAKLSKEEIKNTDAQNKKTKYEDIEDIEGISKTKFFDRIGIVENDTFFIFDTENRNKQNNTINTNGISYYLLNPNKANDNYKKAISHIKSLRKRIFFTNPVFEFWIALHFDKNANMNNYMQIVKDPLNNARHRENQIKKTTYKKQHINNAYEASKKIYNKVLINNKNKKYKRNRINMLTETKKAFSEMHLLIDKLLNTQ